MSRCPFTGEAFCILDADMCPDWDTCTVREVDGDEDENTEFHTCNDCFWFEFAVEKGCCGNQSGDFYDSDVEDMESCEDFDAEINIWK